MLREGYRQIQRVTAGAREASTDVAALDGAVAFAQGAATETLLRTLRLCQSEQQVFAPVFARIC